jgi:hypothetical protein
MTAMHTVVMLISDHIHPFERAVATEVFRLDHAELGQEKLFYVSRKQ